MPRELKLHSKLRPSLPKLISDYLDDTSELSDFYSFRPSVAGIKKAAASRPSFPVNRKVLVDFLSRQAEQSSFSTKQTKAQIARLSSEDVFTITAGHQLCIYGGPMFFLYKILSVIKTCEILKEENVTAVPIYWMASEDHDFAEVNHIFFKTDKASWDVEANGPVGRMKLDDLDAFKKHLVEIVGNDPLKSDTLIKMDQIFSAEKTLSEGIRDFVYWLFADRGVVVLDADDRELKRLFIPVMKEELHSSSSHNGVDQSTNSLIDLGYGGQVTPREINLFWMANGYRDRIERVENGFRTVDGVNSWTASEMIEKLDEKPECFSPNVVLRPVYQEVILPNLAYIGGPGELSYWLQLKGVFDTFNVFYPAVILRDMALIIDAKTIKRLSQLEVQISDINEPFMELFTSLVRRNGSHEHLVEDKRESIETLLSELSELIGDFDPSLQQSADSEKTRILKRLSTLQKKVLRSDRKKNETIERRLTELYASIKPQDAPQERIENWMVFSDSVHINDFLDALQGHFDPFETKITVFETD